MLRTLVLIFIFAIACACATGQSPYFKNYKVRDGLPSNNVYFVFQDSKSYIWLCTDVGVSRFDGAHFTNFTTTNGLSDNEVFLCYEDKTGRLWFATLNGEPCFFQNGKMHGGHDTPQLRGFNLGGIILNIFEEENGDIVLVSNEKRGIVNLEKSIASLERLPNFIVQAWPAKGESFGVVSDSSGLGFIHYNQFSKTVRFPGVVKPVKLGFLHDTLYLTDIHHLLVYDNTTQSQISVTPFPASMNEVIAVNPTPSRLWIGSRNGAYLFDRHSLRLMRKYLPDMQVSAILEDSEGGWWFSTLDQGVFYTPAPEIQQVLNADGSTLGHINCLSADARGRLWFGLPNNTFGTYENGQLAPLQHFPKGLNPRAISAIHHLPDGSTLVAGKAGLVWVKDRRQTFLMLRSTDVGVDAKGDLWSGLTGLFRIPKADIHQLEVPVNLAEEAKVKDYFKRYAPEKISDLRVERIVFDEAGTAWFATPSGLFFYQNEKINGTVLTQNIRDLIFEKKANTLWALTESSGLFSLRNGRVLDSISIASAGQSAAICRDFCQDASGDFWVATASGLMKIEAKDGKLRLVDFTNAQGLSAEKLNAVEIIGEQVFLGKDDGLVAVPVSIFTQKLPPPPVYLKRMLVNDLEQALGGNLEFAASENSVSFSFEGLSFKDYKKLQYRFRLVGLDDTWKTTTNEAVEYASLRPGHYRFEVVAVNSSGVESAVAASQSFEIAPPIWMRWWFIAGALAALAGLVFIWVKRRERKLRRQYEYQRRLMETENEKLELQSKNADLKMLALRLQMNPHFIFNALNTIKGYYGQDKVKEANSYIAKFAKLLRLNLDYSDTYIPLEQEVELLKIYMQLSQIRYPDKMEFSIEMAPDIVPSAVQIPSMVIQPFVENAVIHGIVGKPGKGHVAIVFTKKDAEIVVTIRDNGVGRAAAAAMSKLRDLHKPLATAITQERLELLRKKVAPPAVEIKDVFDENGGAAGTEVVVRLPMEGVKVF